MLTWLYIFLGLALLPQEDESNQLNLSGTSWDVYKTKEVLVNESKTYVRWYGDTTTVKEVPQEVKWYEDDIPKGRKSYNNMLGGRLDLHPDHTGRIWQANIIWSMKDSRTLHVDRDTAEAEWKNQYFFGDFDIESFTDSTAVLYKDLSGTGKWTRQFYLRKLD